MIRSQTMGRSRFPRAAGTLGWTFLALIPLLLATAPAAAKPSGAVLCTADEYGVVNNNQGPAEYHYYNCFVVGGNYCLVGQEGAYTTYDGDASDDWHDEFCVEKIPGNGR